MVCVILNGYAMLIHKKKCLQCKELKMPHEFYRSAKTYDKLFSTCIDCQNMNKKNNPSEIDTIRKNSCWTEFRTK
jgi:hypothetical protein